MVLSAHVLSANPKRNVQPKLNGDGIVCASRDTLLSSIGVPGTRGLTPKKSAKWEALLVLGSTASSYKKKMGTGPVQGPKLIFGPGPAVPMPPHSSPHFIRL